MNERVKWLRANLGLTQTDFGSRINISQNYVWMIEKGERTVEQGKVLNQELKHNAKQKVKEHVSVQVTKKYDKAFECVDEMSAEDLALLKERIAKAEALQKEKQEAEEDVEVEESEENEATTDSEASQVQEDETEQ